MIVYCEKCSSKFKVDETKIPAAGVMASCSVCSHRFLLKREPEVVDLASESVIEQSAAATPAPEKKTFEGFASSIFKEPVTPKNEFAPGAAKTEPARTIPSAAPPVSAGSSQPSASDWDFASFADDLANAAKEGDIEIVTEVTEPDDSAAFTAEVEGNDDLDDIFASDPADTETHPAFKAFEEFMARQSAGKEPAADQRVPKPAVVQETAAVTGRQTPAAAEMKSSAEKQVGPAANRSERIQQEPAGNSTSDYVVRPPMPTVVADGRQTSLQSGLQNSAPAIVSLLEERGLTDEYVVTKVQEVCEATRFVEGVEKPDWQTRIMGLDILCKIRGLYPQEKNNEPPANRQVQIVTGINM